MARDCGSHELHRNVVVQAKVGEQGDAHRGVAHDARSEAGFLDLAALVARAADRVEKDLFCATDRLADADTAAVV